MNLKRREQFRNSTCFWMSGVSEQQKTGFWEAVREAYSILRSCRSGLRLRPPRGWLDEGHLRDEPTRASRFRKMWTDLERLSWLCSYVDLTDQLLCLLWNKRSQLLSWKSLLAAYLDNLIPTSLARFKLILKTFLAFQNATTYFLGQIVFLDAPRLWNGFSKTMASLLLHHFKLEAFATWWLSCLQKNVW